MLFIPSTAGVTYILDKGVTLRAMNALTVAASLSSIFTLQPSETGGIRTIEYTASGTYTVATAQLQRSTDGGTTWVNVGAAIDLFANKTGTFNEVSGVQLRLNLATFTGTSVTLDLNVS